MGLKIAQALLKNSDMWSDLVTTPVLVVCYTNHALDQFLEGGPSAQLKINVTQLINRIYLSVEELDYM